MTKIELVEKISTQLGFLRKEASDHMESVFAIMKQTLASGEDLKISGFGNFEVKQKNPRRGRNPQTGEDLTIESRKIVTYKVSSKLKDRINEHNP
jgi:integration host factor subunit alpha